MLPTIRSRCRRLELPPLDREAIIAAIKSSVGDAVDAADLELAADLAEGSLRRAILLLEEGGIDTYRDLVRLLAGLPDLDIAAAHTLADKVTGRGDDNAYDGFLDLLRAWLDRRVTRQDEPDTGVSLSAAAAAAPLESWAEVWEKIDRSSTATDDLNLDRKRTVLSILMTLARATRM
jgi:DNA polymerase-3 subunit delta'